MINFYYFDIQGKDGNKITTVIATPGQGSDRPQEVSYMDTKVIGNGSFGVVFQAKLCETGELVAIKKVLQDKRFKVSCLFTALEIVFKFIIYLLCLLTLSRPYDVLNVYWKVIF